MLSRLSVLASLIAVVALAGANPPCDVQTTGWGATMPVAFTTAVVTAADPAPAPAPGIKLNARYAVGEKIIVEFEGETIEGAQTSLRWTLPKGVESEGDERRLFLWAAPGTYELALDVTAEIDVFVPDPSDPTNPAKAKPRRLPLASQHYTATLIVGDAPTPKPEPKPQPLDGLAALIPDAAARRAVAEFAADLAAAIRQGAFTSTSHFRAGYRKAIADAQAAGTLPKGLAPLDKPISDRVTAAVGLADAPMDAAKTAALAAVFDAVALDLGR